jgi:transcriptional regulator of acetoin/glycerol metabolism
MRDDFYYRICERLLQLPSLRARIDDNPYELFLLTYVFAVEIAGPARGAGLVEEVMRVLATPELRDHPWPGNVRELRACVSSVHTHGRYVPRSRVGEEPWAREPEAFPTMEEMKRRHAHAAMEVTGDLMEAARLLGIDHKTLRRLLDADPDATLRAV